jgi:hypothetical protein
MSTKIFAQQSFSNLKITPPSVVVVESLIIAGGAGGGSGGANVAGGGGGAGGMLSYNLVVTKSSPISITVGAGGAEVTDGNFSSFGSIYATGGGAAISYGSGRIGGSGGGAAGVNSSIGLRILGQGNNGALGQGTVGVTAVSGGGGGGAGGAGIQPVNTSSNGEGGAGLSNSITGSPVTYSSGGRGRSSFAYSPGINGSTNTGNGGEGTGGDGGTAGSGGSGVVIIAYQDINLPLSISGGLSYTQPSRVGYRVYRFTGGTGTVTFN